MDRKINPYATLEQEEDGMPQARVDKKRVYFEFLLDFKDYLAEYVKESVYELTISQIQVNEIPQKLFAGASGGIHVVVKNQGLVPCYLSTDRTGAYRLDPNEKEGFWLNHETIAVTVSGTTTLGFIRS
jgi:hypothetical protein